MEHELRNMKTRKGNFLGTFVFSKLPKKLTASQSFCVVPRIFIQTNIARFHKGEADIFYSPKSDNQTMTYTKGGWAFSAPVSFYSIEPFQLLNGRIINANTNLKSTLLEFN